MHLCVYGMLQSKKLLFYFQCFEGRALFSFESFVLFNFVLWYLLSRTVWTTGQLFYQYSFLRHLISRYIGHSLLLEERWGKHLHSVEQKVCCNWSIFLNRLPSNLWCKFLASCLRDWWRLLALVSVWHCFGRQVMLNKVGLWIPPMQILYVLVFDMILWSSCLQFCHCLKSFLDIFLIFYLCLNTFIFPISTVLLCAKVAILLDESWTGTSNTSKCLPLQ